MSKNKSTIDLTSGRIILGLVKFALPLMAGNVLQQCYNLTDTLVVGSQGVICRKPVASSSLARFKAPASNTRKGLPAKAPLIVPLTSWLSLARRAVVGRSPIFPLCKVAPIVVLKPLTTLDSGSQDWSKLILDLCSF